MIIDRFSEGLDDLTRKQQRSQTEVLKQLHKMSRFSIFEATANQDIASTMDKLCAGKFIETDNTCGYPWTKVKLTSLGLEKIGFSPVEDKT